MIQKSDLKKIAAWSFLVSAFFSIWLVLYFYMIANYTSVYTIGNAIQDFFKIFLPIFCVLFFYIGSIIISKTINKNNQENIKKTSRRFATFPGLLAIIISGLWMLFSYSQSLNCPHCGDMYGGAVFLVLFGIFIIGIILYVIGTTLSWIATRYFLNKSNQWLSEIY